MPEKPTKRRTENNRSLVASVLVAVILLPAGVYLAITVLAFGDTTEEFYDSHVSQGDNCLWGLEIDARLHHWEYLRRIREDVIRYGKRDEKGLADCQNCHVSKVNFCDRCHAKVSLTPDCFHCHYYPEPSGESHVQLPPTDAESPAEEAIMALARLPER